MFPNLLRPPVVPNINFFERSGRKKLKSEIEYFEDMQEGKVATIQVNEEIIEKIKQVDME